MMRALRGVAGSLVCMLLATDPAWYHVQFEAAVAALRVELTRVGWRVLQWRRREK